MLLHVVLDRLGCLLGRLSDLLVGIVRHGLQGGDVLLGLPGVHHAGVEAGLLGDPGGGRLVLGDADRHGAGLEDERGAGPGGLVVGLGVTHEGDGLGPGVLVLGLVVRVPGLAVDVDLGHLVIDQGLEQLGSGLGAAPAGAGVGRGLDDLLEDLLPAGSLQQAVGLAVEVAPAGQAGDGAGQVEAAAGDAAHGGCHAQARPEVRRVQGGGVHAAADLMHGMGELGDGFLGGFPTGVEKQPAGGAGQGRRHGLGHATGRQGADEALGAGGAEQGRDDGLDAPGAKPVGPALVLAGQDALADRQGLRGDACSCGAGAVGRQLAAAHDGLDACQRRQGGAGEHQRGVGGEPAQAAAHVGPEARVVDGAGLGDLAELLLQAAGVTARQGLHQAQGAAARVDEAGGEGAAVLGRLGAHGALDIIDHGEVLLLAHGCEQVGGGAVVGAVVADLGAEDGPALVPGVVGTVGDEPLDGGQARQVVQADGQVLGLLGQPGGDLGRAAAVGVGVEGGRLGVLLDGVEVPIDQVGGQAGARLQAADPAGAGGVLHDAGAG